VITVQDWPDHTGVLQTDRYAFGSTYTALAAPTRIVDSRTGLGLATALGEGVGKSTAFQVTGTTGPVPKSATAITGNLTVTGQTAAGYVSLTPTKPSTTPATSTLNFPRADTRANGVTAPLGSTGLLYATYISSPVSSAATVEIIFDVTGYFTADTTGTTYHPLAGPVRIVDSRIPLGLPTKLADGVPQSFHVTGVGGVPAGATAITGNLTVTGQTKAGYVALTTTSESAPTTSTINFPVGDNRANGVTTPLGAGGTLWAVYRSNPAGGTTQLVFDVTGYFTADATGTTYVSLVPARILDTRSNVGLTGPFASHVARTFQVTGQGGVPAFASAITGNLTVTDQTAGGYVALTTTATNNPSTSTLNFPIADNRANGVTSPLGAGGSLSATYGAAASGDTTALILDVTGFFH